GTNGGAGLRIFGRFSTKTALPGLGLNGASSNPNTFLANQNTITTSGTAVNATSTNAFQSTCPPTLASVPKMGTGTSGIETASAERSPQSGTLAMMAAAARVRNDSETDSPQVAGAGNSSAAGFSPKRTFTAQAALRKLSRGL